MSQIETSATEVVNPDTVSEMITKASREHKAPEHGVVITRHWNGPSKASDIVIWTTRTGRMVEHRLSEEATDYERLSAHLAGFIEQVANKAG